MYSRPSTTWASTGADFVGASFGGGVAVDVALTRPELVRVAAPVPAGRQPARRADGGPERFFDAERAALARDDLDDAAVVDVDTWWSRTGRADIDPAVVDAVRMMQRQAFEVLGGLVACRPPEAELEPPALERISEITARTLVLVGGHDLETTHDAAARVVAGIAGARRIERLDVAHLPSMERPQAFVDHLMPTGRPRAPSAQMGSSG